MEKQKIIRKTEDFANAVGDMHKAMDAAKVEAPEQINKITEFNKRFPDAKYLKPTVSIPTQGVRHAEIDKQKDFLLEYVVGILESTQIVGSLSFFLGEIPGEDYCQWTIPFNKQVGIPRFVALHLQKSGAWKEMKPLGRDNEPSSFYEEDMMTPFYRFDTKRRFYFHPVNSYA